MLLDQRVDALRNARNAAAEAELGELRLRADPRGAAAQRGLELVSPVAIRRHDAEAGHDHALRHLGTPMPESVPEHTRVPSSSFISTAQRSLRRRKNTTRPVVMTRIPGRTIPLNSTSASVNKVVYLAASSEPISRSSRWIPSATTPAWAIASIRITPGVIGLPGKWPR